MPLPIRKANNIDFAKVRHKTFVLYTVDIRPIQNYVTAEECTIKVTDPRVRNINLQATKLFTVTSATKGGSYHPLKLSYRVIQRLIQHCLLSKIVHLNVKYVIATRNFEFF